MFTVIKSLKGTYLKLFFARNFSCSQDLCKMELGQVVTAMQEIAPIQFAGGWDNVGLLVEPSLPHRVSKIMLTNDLTEPVLSECLQNRVDMVVSYHPPIFRPIKRLVSSDWKSRIIVKAIENRVAVYSPHTACDAVQSGVNDWLSKCLGELESSHPVELNESQPLQNRLVTFKLKTCTEDDKKFLQRLKEQFSSAEFTETSEGLVNFKLACSNQTLTLLVALAEQQKHNTEHWQVTNLSALPLPSVGPGRLCKLSQPTTIKTLVNQVKEHLEIPFVRLALGAGQNIDSEVGTVALCAGSGASVLSNVKADLFLTGEMSHHEVLDAASKSTAVILCDHTNTERGYLKVLREQLCEKLKGVDVLISVTDKDPLSVV